MRTIRELLFLSCLALLLGAAEVDPDPTRVLPRALEASGGAGAWGRAVALKSIGRISAGGETGAFHSMEELTSGRYVSSFEIGLFASGQGFDGTTAWLTQPGGDANEIDAGGALATVADQAWLAARAYWFPDRREGAVEYSRTVSDEGGRYEVLEAAPAGGGQVELWFDAASGLLSRIVTAETGESATEFLSDYREVDGLTIPFERRIRRGDPRYDVVITLDEVEVLEAVAPEVFAKPAGRPHDYRFAGSARSTTVPFELSSNHIYLHVHLNGQERRFLFDSGGVNLLTRSAADALGLEPQGEVRGQGAGEESMPITLVEVAELAIGAAVLTDQVFFVAPLDALGSAHGAHFDGLIGYEVLRRFVVQIDYERQRLTLVDPDEFDDSGRAPPIRLRFAERIPIVEGSIDGLAGEFSLDTGARGSITLTSPFSERHGLVASYHAGAERVVGWGVGGAVMGRVARARVLELGGVAVEWPVVELYTGERGAFADESLAGNVGGGVLRRFNVTFDYPRRRLYLEPNARHDQPDLYDRSGLALKAEDGGIVIADVAATSPAERAGLRTGDRLRAFDDRAVAADALREVRRALTQRPAASVLRVTYERDGRTFETRLVLADLLPPDPRERS